MPDMNSKGLNTMIYSNIKKAITLVTLFYTSLLFGTTALAVPTYMVYQGQVFDPSGMPLEDPSVDFKISIYAPGGVCLLFEENHTGKNMANSGGVFSLEVGTGTTTGSDPGIGLYQAFNAIDSGGVGCYSTPGQFDKREVVVEFTTASAGAVSLASQKLDSAPYAMYATSLDGVATAVGNRIGIGTATPSQALHVIGNTRIDGPSPLIQFNDTTQASGAFASIGALDGGLALSSFTSAIANPVIFINNSANTGIGTINPQAKLQVVGPDGLLNRTFSSRLLGATNNPSIYTSHDEATGQSRLGFSGSTGFWGSLAVGNNDVISLFPNGNVGIGTNTPRVISSVSKALTIDGNTTVSGPDIEFVGNDVAASGTPLGRTMFINNVSGVPSLNAMIGGYSTSRGQDSGNLRFYTKDSGSALAERMIINERGNTGFATPGPTERIHVNGPARIQGYEFEVYVDETLGAHDHENKIFTSPSAAYEYLKTIKIADNYYYVINLGHSNSNDGGDGFGPLSIGYMQNPIKISGDTTNPANVSINGNIEFHDTQIAYVEGVTVNGTLNVARSTYIYLDKVDIVSLANGLQVNNHSFVAISGDVNINSRYNGITINYNSQVSVIASDIAIDFNNGETLYSGISVSSNSSFYSNVTSTFALKSLSPGPAGTGVGASFSSSLSYYNVSVENTANCFSLVEGSKSHVRGNVNCLDSTRGVYTRSFSHFNLIGANPKIFENISSYVFLAAEQSRITFLIATGCEVRGTNGRKFTGNEYSIIKYSANCTDGAGVSYSNADQLATGALLL